MHFKVPTIKSMFYLRFFLGKHMFLVSHKYKHSEQKLCQRFLISDKYLVGCSQLPVGRGISFKSANSFWSLIPNGLCMWPGSILSKNTPYCFLSNPTRGRLVMTWTLSYRAPVDPPSQSLWPNFHIETSPPTCPSGGWWRKKRKEPNWIWGMVDTPLSIQSGWLVKGGAVMCVVEGRLKDMR